MTSEYGIYEYNYTFVVQCVKYTQQLILQLSHKFPVKFTISKYFPTFLTSLKKKSKLAQCLFSIFTNEKCCFGLYG